MGVDGEAETGAEMAAAGEAGDGGESGLPSGANFERSPLQKWS